MKLEDLRIKIFADGADLETMIRLNDDPLIKGLTTNPTLMRKAGITNYEAFAKEVLKHVTKKPISFEVFSDEFSEMERQAHKISSWGENVLVKIPVMNSRGEYTFNVIESLSKSGVKVNATAILLPFDAAGAADSGAKIISVFSGRISDTGKWVFGPMGDKGEYLWASTREPFNIWWAMEKGYHIITVPEPILEKARKMWEYNLAALTVETVQMFKKDSEGYTL